LDKYLYTRTGATKRKGFLSPKELNKRITYILIAIKVHLQTFQSGNKLTWISSNNRNKNNILLRYIMILQQKVLYNTDVL